MSSITKEKEGCFSFECPLEPPPPLGEIPRSTCPSETAASETRTGHGLTQGTA